jgi:hypothetical protein
MPISSSATKILFADMAFNLLSSARFMTCPFLLASLFYYVKYYPVWFGTAAFQ